MLDRQFGLLLENRCGLIYLFELGDRIGCGAKRGC